LYTLAGTYRPVEGSTILDVVGGLRLASIKWDVSTQASIPVLSATDRRTTETKTWTDPFFGAQVQQRLSETWSLMGYLDVGGFGVGSKLSWQAMVGGSYAFTPGIVAKAGYRYISEDYDKSDFKYDMDNAGVYLGVGFRW
jgi:opacity protein-like surface antigen